MQDIVAQLMAIVLLKLFTLLQHLIMPQYPLSFATLGVANQMGINNWTWREVYRCGKCEKNTHWFPPGVRLGIGLYIQTLRLEKLQIFFLNSLYSVSLHIYEMGMLNPLALFKFWKCYCSNEA